MALATPAFAQLAPAPTQTFDNDIIVTAQRRSQRLESATGGAIFVETLAPSDTLTAGPRDDARHDLAQLSL